MALVAVSCVTLKIIKIVEPLVGMDHDLLLVAALGDRTDWNYEFFWNSRDRLARVGC